MYRSRPNAAAALLVAVAAAAGCGRADSPLEATASASRGAAEASRADPPGLDGEFLRLARRIPGFAGYYFDGNGNLVVTLTDLRQEPAARAAVAAVAARGSGRSGGAPAILVREVAYDFMRLDGWRGQMRALLSLRGTVFLDTDEAANRLRIGVEDAAASDEVERRLAALGVPREAVIIETAPAPRLAAALYDYVRPVDAGVEIDFTGGYCTLTANLNYWNPYYGASGTPSFMTASHCTATRGAADGRAYAQGGAWIGAEYVDPAFWSGGGCPAGRRCRYSDVALGQYNAGVSYELGQIARTTYAGSTSPGSIVIDSWNPKFPFSYGSSSLSYPTLGQYIEKVGATSGWTRGPVTATCVDYQQSPDITLFCQARVDALAQPGDSGSPAFYLGYYGNELKGIVWGADWSVPYYVFSPMQNVENDLGHSSMAF